MKRYYDDGLKAWITVCKPAPAALGADSLQDWAYRRQLDVPASNPKLERQENRAWRNGKPISKFKRRNRRFPRP